MENRWIRSELKIIVCLYTVDPDLHTFALKIKLKIY